MGVIVQYYADDCMPHDVLQCLWVHPGFCHIRTEGVPAHIRNYLRHLDAVNLVILSDDIRQVLLQMKGCYGHIILVQTHKTNESIYHRLCFGNRTVGNAMLRRKQKAALRTSAHSRLQRWRTFTACPQTI